MTGVAIISLDCEGRWGVADHLSPEVESGLTDYRLRSAYRDIIDLFEEVGLSATFAFVELYTRTQSNELTQLVRHLSEDMPYLEKAAEGLLLGQEGWIGDWALEMASSGLHEIAFHGATHVPWTELSPSQARREMEMTRRERRQTMVFPRNRVAHLDILAEYGCKAFRGSRDFSSRAHSLLSEFDLRAPSQPKPCAYQGDPVELPSGIFVNWRSGLRKLIPPQITQRRARHLLAHAAKSNGVAHFWLHPENVAAAPATFANLQAIVSEIVRFRDLGHIRVETQLSILDG